MTKKARAELNMLDKFIAWIYPSSACESCVVANNGRKIMKAEIAAYFVVLAAEPSRSRLVMFSNSKQNAQPKLLLLVIMQLQ